jgi:hypothetical protein
MALQSHPRYPSAEIVRRGQALYDEQIREKVEAANKGKFLVVNIETGEYQIDTDSYAAYERAASRHPGAALYLLRIGYPAAVRLGKAIWMRGE